MRFGGIFSSHKDHSSPVMVTCCPPPPATVSCPSGLAFLHLPHWRNRPGLGPAFRGPMCQNRTDLAWPPGEGPWSSHSSARADWVAVQCPAFLHSAGGFRAGLVHVVCGDRFPIRGPAHGILGATETLTTFPDVPWGRGHRSGGRVLAVPLTGETGYL